MVDTRLMIILDSRGDTGLDSSSACNFFFLVSFSAFWLYYCFYPLRALTHYLVYSHPDPLVCPILIPMPSLSFDFR